MKTTPSLNQNLSAATLPLALAVLTILFGQGMGIVFGLNEDAIKSRLSASAAAKESLKWLAKEPRGQSMIYDIFATC